MSWGQVIFLSLSFFMGCSVVTVGLMEISKSINRHVRLDLIKASSKTSSMSTN